MGKGWLIVLVPFLLAGMNHYFNHKRQMDRDKQSQRQPEKRQRAKKKEITYDHEWPDDEE